MKMKMKIAAPILFFLPLYLLQISSADDTLNPDQSFKDGQTLISAEQIFELGFFSPNHSTHRYFGIWYHSIPIQTVVWVANREDPLLDLSGTLTIESDGNLVLRDGSQKLLWSTNTSTGSNRTRARLLDNGNLVLADGNSEDSEIVLWQSFDYPSNTLLPGMKLGLNKRTQENRFLVSWKTDADPSLGAFSYGLDVNDSYQFFIWNGSAPHWRSGFWNRRAYNEIVQPSTRPSSRYVFHFNTVNNEQEAYFEYSALYNNTRLLMDVSGQVKCMIWFDTSMTWEVVWSQPRDQCGTYDICGVNSKCNDYETTMCECLPGFEPVSPKDWNSKDWTQGCKRKRPLECGGRDVFLALGRLKVPDGEVVLEAQSLETCRDKCSNNCSCHAFVYANMSSGGSCLVWSGNLTDIGYLKENEGSEDIYLRLMESDLDMGSRKKRSLLPVIVSVTTIIGIFLLGTIICCLWRRNAKRKGNVVRFFEMFSSNSLEDAPIAKHFLDSSDFSKEGKEGLDIPSYSFGCIARSANHFSENNMLGKGGFGPVYKGKLPDGQEIAVKRLSRQSGQGLEEFRNEVILIAKLQHRNLVRLLGYSIKEEEKLLIYEYMPNKSLDSFLFDPHRCNLLDWKKRYNIILGIARGLLYLHQDSRLRIIHRDLKTSNILLDEELNPKISDFGMARIFGGNQTEGNTGRVMGTYGYMSPEYALDGLFSVKSDIFSFGVILLEIVSGKKNNNFYHSDESLSLLGYAWKLWKEDKGMDMTYECLSESTAADRCEMLKCIQLALLCVQEDPADRPSMASIVTSLVTENTSLPMPKQPPSYVRKYFTEQGASRNQITVTQLEGR